MELGLLTVFAAGLLTLATPCILPMLPVYFALLLGEGVGSARDQEGAAGRFRLLGVSALFVAGFGTLFTLLGMAASTVGGALQSHRALLLVLGGVVIVLFGLKMLGVIRVAWLDRTLQASPLRTGSRGLNAFAFGVVFALGWTPCVGPVLGTVLTFTAATTSSAATGALYLFVYSLGVGLPLLAVSAMADRLVPLLRKVYRHLPKLERGTGALLLVVGLAVAVPGVMQLRSSSAAAAEGQPSSSLLTLGQPSERPRFVEFFAERCPVCERMEPLVQQLSADCVGHRIEVVQVNVSEPSGAALARRYGIHAVPAFVLLDEQGDRSGQLYGERGLGELRAAAASLISATCAGEVARADFSDPAGLPSCAAALETQPLPGAPAEPEVAECTSDAAPEVSPN